MHKLLLNQLINGFGREIEGRQAGHLKTQDYFGMVIFGEVKLDRDKIKYPKYGVK